MPGFFLKGKSMEEQKITQNNTSDIKRTKAEIYESLYDGE